MLAAVLAALFPLFAGAAMAGPPPTPVAFPPFEQLPGVDDPAIAPLWRRALELEAGGEYGEAAAAYEELAARLPAAALPRWRAARAHWDRGLRLPEADAEDRAEIHRLTREWAERGLAVDPDCGECHLYKAAGIGGAVRDAGALAGALQVDEIAALLERGILLVRRQPAAEDNPELEELYYAAAQLYRSVPDSGVLRWALGVPGDRRRAVEYLREATRLAGGKPAWTLELGALLLCRGRKENDVPTMAEGFDVLHRLLARTDGVADDERRAARELVDDPARCDAVGSAWSAPGP